MQKPRGLRWGEAAAVRNSNQEVQVVYELLDGNDNLWVVGDRQVCEQAATILLSNAQRGQIRWRKAVENAFIVRWLCVYVHGDGQRWCSVTSTLSCIMMHVRTSSGVGAVQCILNSNQDVRCVCDCNTHTHTHTYTHQHENTFTHACTRPHTHQYPLGSRPLATPVSVSRWWVIGWVLFLCVRMQVNAYIV